MLMLTRGNLSASISPEFGGTICALEYYDPDGTRIPILEPLEDPAAGLKAGSFIMAPFCNRIADGRFTFDGKTFQIPVTRPEEGMAIHGYARERPWEVVSAGTDHALLRLQFHEPDLPWRFDIEQEITLSNTALGVALRMVNRGDQPMPFGFGLHPWFPKLPGTTLTLANRGAYQQDARNLPIAQTAPREGFQPGAALSLTDIPLIDTCFAGWQPPKAEIAMHNDGVAVILTASGALDYLHVYVPDNRAVFCAEPVSHLPDVLNRPDLGAEAAMTVLAPGEMLEGGMELRVEQRR